MPRQATELDVVWFLGLANQPEAWIFVLVERMAHATRASLAKGIVFRHVGSARRVLADPRVRDSDIVLLLLMFLVGVVLLA